MKKKLPRDPYNIIITGVGGQGNVMASRLLGNILVNRGFFVTIGETFGASQRGGSVMSHVRVSEKSVWSPQIPRGKADMVVSLEPVESIRVMAAYGNRQTKVISNTRPIYPVQVIAGELSYPSMQEIQESLAQLTDDITFIDASDRAIELGNPILGNIIMIGAVLGTGELPVDEKDFNKTIPAFVPEKALDLNMDAFRIGGELTRA